MLQRAGRTAGAVQRLDVRHSTRRLTGVSIAMLLLCACGGGGGTTPSAGIGAITPSAAPSATPSSAPVSSGREPSVAGCQIFPSNNPWNTDISSLPVDPNSAAYLASMNASTTFLHPDFGSNPTYGIPYTSVPGSQPFVPIMFTLYGSQSDPGPYPIPANAPVEGGPGATGDRHVIVVDSGNCKDYEMYAAQYVGPGWDAGSGAVFNLSSNALRPDYWTSADAAGLPILAGLVRYDEAAQNGAIYHALRFTVHATQAGFIHPATHYASSSTDPSLPPMGLRVRLKASFDVSPFTGASHAVLVALQHYGMLVADNGSDWFITGATDTRWDDNDLNQLKTVPASAFEVVQTGTIVH